MIDDDELPLHARALLAAARGADDPAAGDQARVAAALGPKLAALGIAPALLAPALLAPAPLAAAPPAAAAVATTAAGAGSAAKFALLLVGASVAAGGMIHVANEHARSPQSAHASAPATRRAAGSTAPALTAATPLPAPQPVVAVAPGASDSSTTVPALDAASATAPPHTTHSAHAAVQREAKIAASSVPAADAAPAAPVAPSAPARVEALREEVALIDRASAALRDNHASAALRLLDEHAARFAHGLLGEEQRGLRVLALCKLGPSSGAIEARAAFLRDAPNSLLVPKVRAACATKMLNDAAQGKP